MNTSKTAAQLMTRKLLVAHADWSIDRLMEFLTDHGISGAPVVGGDDRKNPIGVVSHSDIARNGVTTEETREGPQPPHSYYRTMESVVAREEVSRFHAAESDSRLTVRDIMTPMVFAVEEDTPVQEIAGMMVTGKIHRVFVRRGDKLTGIITAMDLLPIVRDL